MDVASNVQVSTLFSALARLIDTNGTGIDISGLEDNLLVIWDSAAAGAGTNPTADLTFEHRADATDSWAAIPADALYDPDTGEAATFDQITTVAAVQKLALRRNRLKAQIRAVFNIGGTNSPSFVFSAYLIGTPKYRGWQ